MAENEEGQVEDWGASDPGDNAESQSPTLAPIVPDTAPYRIAVWAMAATIVISIIGSLALAAFDKQIPEMVVAVASACVGAIGGMLAPGRGR